MIDRAQLTSWMTAAADGERAAIDPLFHALWPVALAYATRMLGDRAAAEDATQDALVAVFAQLHRFDRTRDALTWALTHVTWTCRTARRTRARRGEQPAEHAPEAALDGRAAAEERDLIRAAIAELGELPPRDAETIIASLREQPGDATVRKRLERALVRLRAAWRSRHGEV